MMHGWPGITAVYYLPGPHPALIETGPGSSIDSVTRGLDEAGVDSIEWIVLTHIHLDHAGAVGHLAGRFPSAKIVVRQEGAAHLVDPSRLWASASRIYQDMDAMWGRMIPVPEDRIVSISGDGPIADLGDGRRLQAVYSPGHAKHHMAVFEAGNADLFTGDALGVYLPEARAIRPATPPPEFDMEVAISSIRMLSKLGAARVFPTHFGPVPEPRSAFDEGESRLRQWVDAAAVVRAAGGGQPEIAQSFRDRRDEFYPGLDEALLDKFDQTTSYDMNAMGIERYLRKKAEAETETEAGDR